MTSAREVRAALRGFAEAKTNAHDAESMEAISRTVEWFTEIVPVEQNPGTLVDDLSRGGGKSGHIVLNWRRLVDTLAAAPGSRPPVGQSVRPELVPLAALYVWDKVWLCKEEQLSDGEALTILALWKHRTARNLIGDQEGFLHTNELRASVGLHPLRRSAYQRAIARLVSLECLEVDAGLVWLREWVMVDY